MKLTKTQLETLRFFGSRNYHFVRDLPCSASTARRMAEMGLLHYSTAQGGRLATASITPVGRTAIAEWKEE